MKTPRSLNYFVINTTGNLDFLVYFVTTLKLIYKKITGAIYCRKSRLPVYSSRGSVDSLVYQAPGKFFANQFFFVDIPLMNTSGSPDSPLGNTPGVYYEYE